MTGYPGSAGLQDSETQCRLGTANQHVIAALRGHVDLAVDRRCAADAPPGATEPGRVTSQAARARRHAAAVSDMVAG